MIISNRDTNNPDTVCIHSANGIEIMMLHRDIGKIRLMSVDKLSDKTIANNMISKS
jgi:hypothetical protein